MSSVVQRPLAPRVPGSFRRLPNIGRYAWPQRRLALRTGEGLPNRVSLAWRCSVVGPGGARMRITLKFGAYPIIALRARYPGAFFFFGEQMLQAVGRPPFEFMAEMPTRIMYHIGAPPCNVVASAEQALLCDKHRRRGRNQRWPRRRDSMTDDAPNDR